MATDSNATDSPGQLAETLPTPGRAAHDTWCADDDWHLIDDEARQLWEDTAQAGHAAIVAAEQPRTGRRPGE